MAKFRKIHTSFWADEFVANLTPEQKYFYLYLLTNNNTRQCGIYELSKRMICFDTGYNMETVSKLLTYFVEAKKIILSPKTNEIVVLNWLRYNDSSSPKVQQCIKSELKTVKNKVLIEYLYSIDTQSQEEVEVRKELRIRKEVEGGDAATTPLFLKLIEILNTERQEIPEDVLKNEANKIMIAKPKIDPKKDLPYIKEWARRLGYAQPAPVVNDLVRRIERYQSDKVQRKKEYDKYSMPGDGPFIDINPKDYGLTPEQVNHIK